MDESAEIKGTVTLRVSRFAPRAGHDHTRSHSPFARSTSTSPFATSSTRRARRGKHWSQDYTLHVSANTTLLDCLLTIKRTVDPTLAFRYACGHGMCGSDAVNVNGVTTLLCTTTVRSAVEHPVSEHPSHAVGTEPEPSSSGFRRTGVHDAAEEAVPPAPATDMTDTDWGLIEIAPLPGFPVERDLIVDIDPMIQQITKLQPYLQARGELSVTEDGNVDIREYLQHPEELARYELLSDCIACGVCEGSCPVFAGGDAFIGPAALVAASRFINDSRDGAAQERLAAIDTADGIAACQSVRACGRRCPRGIDVGEEMWQLTTKVNERNTNGKTTPTNQTTTVGSYE